MKGALRKVIRISLYAKSFAIGRSYANGCELQSEPVKTNTALQLKDATK